jgi:DNA-binding beta-propeller fold protein YncE
MNHMRWARRVLIGIPAGLVVIVVLAVFTLNIYLAALPAATTVRSLGAISVPASFRITRPFIDYMELHGQRLYVAFASHNLVGVIDTTTNAPIGAIEGLQRVHGVALVPELGLGFATAGNEDMVGVFNLADNQLVKTIPAGTDPDAIIYDEKLHLVYVADHGGKMGTLIDPRTETSVATIDLGGEPEFCQADPSSGLIYQNLEDTSEVVVIDPWIRAVIRRYKLAPGEGPTGLALDAVNRRLFSTTGNKKLIVLNSDTGEIVADLPIGLLVDGVAYDPGLKRIYTANGIGTMTVIQQDSADRYRVIENAPTHFGGHSVVVDPVTHRIYVAYFGRVAVYEPTPR